MGSHESLSDLGSTMGGAGDIGGVIAPQARGGSTVGLGPVAGHTMPSVSTAPPMTGVPVSATAGFHG